MKTKVLVDSGSDISLDDKKKYDIDVVPLSLIIDGLAQDDFYNFNIKEYCNILKNSLIQTTTSQPNPNTFISYFRRYEKDYTDIIIITMSHNGSGTYNSASLAKSLYRDSGGRLRVHIIDSLSTSYVITLLGIKASLLAKSGLSACEIVKKIDYIKHNYRVYFLIDNIDFLIRGGRISSIKGKVISTFQVKPIISVKEGYGQVAAKSIGFKNGLTKLAKIFEKERSVKTKLHIMHADCLKSANNLVSLIKKIDSNIECFIHTMNGVMCTHAGPGSISIVFEANNI